MVIGKLLLLSKYPLFEKKNKKKSIGIVWTNMVGVLQSSNPYKYALLFHSKKFNKMKIEIKGSMQQQRANDKT